MIKGREWRAGWASLTGVGVVLSSCGAWAADAPAAGPTSPDVGLSREQVNPSQQIPQAKRRPPDVFAAPMKEVCQLSDSPTLAFEFKQGVLEDDAKVLSEHDRQVAWGGLLGKRITPRQLCDIRDQLAARIFHRGILARVIIPPQTIAGGVVRFRVIAAKIVAVRFDGDDIGPAQAKVEAFLNHLRGQNAFSLDDAQRWLLLVNDIPGVLAVARIVHSSAPGAPPEGLDLVVTLRRAPLDEAGMISNTNAQTLGPWTGLARVDFNSFTPLRERTSLVVTSTLGNYRQEVVEILESARVGDSGLFAQASFAYGYSRPGNVLAPLDLTGDSYTGSFEFDYPVIRLQRESLILASGMDFINQRTTEPGQVISDDALRVVWLRADSALAATDRSWGNLLYSTAADLSVQARKGLDVLGASQAGAIDLSRTDGRSDAWVVRAEGHGSFRIAPLDGKWLPITFTTHFMGQWADRPLLAYEQQAIGNLTIGRGYDPSAASGDEVVGGEIKAELGPISAGKGGLVKLTPYLFDDNMYVSYLGTAAQLGTGTENVTLRSLGGGLEVKVPYDARGDSVRMDLGYAKPLDRPIPSEVKKPPERFLVQIIVNH
jgi:hemolysin activation/secretion protein